MPGLRGTELGNAASRISAGVHGATWAPLPPHSPFATETPCAWARKNREEREKNGPENAELGDRHRTAGIPPPPSTVRWGPSCRSGSTGGAAPGAGRNEGPGRCAVGFSGSPQDEPVVPWAGLDACDAYRSWIIRGGDESGKSRGPGSARPVARDALCLGNGPPSLCFIVMLSMPMVLGGAATTASPVARGKLPLSPGAADTGPGRLAMGRAKFAHTICIPERVFVAPRRRDRMGGGKPAANGRFTISGKCQFRNRRGKITSTMNQI